MVDAFPTIGIIGKRGGPGVAAAIQRVADKLAERGRRVLLDAVSAAVVPGWQGGTAARGEMGAHCDLIVVIGGDGTLLDAAHAALDHDTPLLGVNLGRLGFLVDVLPNAVDEALDQVLGGDYVRDERVLLQATVLRAAGGEVGPFRALNEVVVRNAELARVLEFETYVDGVFISHHRADGIIVATPTGSTAYAMSGGGPVLHPAIQAIALVPICPHALSDRPLVLDARGRVEVAIADGNTPALFTADGRESEMLGAGDRVLVAPAPQRLTLIHPPGYDYFSILRSKLHWGRGRGAAP